MQIDTPGWSIHIAGSEIQLSIAKDIRIEIEQIKITKNVFVTKLSLYGLLKQLSLSIFWSPNSFSERTDNNISEQPAHLKKT